MDLYFLRHAIADKRGDPRYRDDSLRPLTGQGREKMRQASLGMQRLGLKFDVVFSSPYLRARQTAEIVAQCYKIKKDAIRLTDNLLPPASISALLQEIYTLKGNALLVGHEPHLTELVSSLLKCPKPLDIDFKKGGLCCLTVHRSTRNTSAVLNWLLTPTQLGLMAKEKRSASRPQ